MPNALAGWLRDVRAVLLAADPALSRLRMGLRVTLTLVTVGLVLTGLHALTPLPIAAYGVTVITAMQGTLAVRDATSSARAVTRLVSGLAGLVAIAVATLLAPWPAVSDAVFICFVFGAVYARRYGPRGHAAGMFAFMCYFSGAYLHPGVADLPAIAAAIVLSGVIAHLIRNLVLPERRAGDFRRTLGAIGNHLSRLAAMVDAGAAQGWTGEKRREALRQQEKVGDAILTAEGLLPQEADMHGEAARLRELAIALFDLHLASETLLLTALRAGSATPLPDGRMPLELARERLAWAREIALREAAAVPAAWLDGAAAASHFALDVLSHIVDRAAHGGTRVGAAVPE